MIEDELCWLATSAGYLHEKGVFSDLPLKGDQLSISRPARKAHQLFTKGQLSPLPVADGRNPNIQSTVLREVKCYFLTVWRELGELHSFTQIQQWLFFTRRK